MLEKQFRPLCGASGEFPLVSVGVPVRNGAATLRRALESVLAQDYPRLEIIISDNGSDDETYAICREFSEKDARVRVLRQSRNIGAVGNFRAVLAEAQGDFFMWAAADDLWHPEFLPAMLEELLHHPDAIVAMCAVERVHNDGRLFDQVRFVGRDDPNSLTGMALLRRVFSPAKFNFFIYGLFRKAPLRAAMQAFPDVLGGDRQFIGLLALCGNFRYVDRILHTRTHQVAHNESYRKNAVGWRTKSKQMLAFFRMILLSSLVPYQHKFSLPLAAYSYAAFIARNPSMRTQLLLTAVAVSMVALAMALLVPHFGISVWTASYAVLAAAGLGAICVLLLVRNYVLRSYGLLYETASQGRVLRTELRYLAEMLVDHDGWAPPRKDENLLADHVEARRERTRKAFLFVQHQGQSRLRQVHLRQLFPGIETATLPVAAVDSRPGNMAATEGLFLCAIVKHRNPGEVLIFENGGELSRYLWLAGLRARTTRVIVPNCERSEHDEGENAPSPNELGPEVVTISDVRGFDGAFDLIVIDGGLGYEQLRADTEAAFRSLRPGGLVLWRGYTPRNSGLQRFVVELTQQQPLFKVKGAGLLAYLDGVNPLRARLPELPKDVLERMLGEESGMLEDLYA